MIGLVESRWDDANHFLMSRFCAQEWVELILGRWKKKAVLSVGGEE